MSVYDKIDNDIDKAIQMDIRLNSLFKKILDKIDMNVYQGKDAGVPDLHSYYAWYFEPKDWYTNEIYSKPFDSELDAIISAAQHYYEIMHGDDI